MSWLNYSLINYAAKKNILPNTQVAGQPGVQTRDLMSFLAGIKTWSLRNKKPVYAVKRDQMKGFDYLSPDGFYDASTFTTSMGHYYLHDLLSDDPNALKISSTTHQQGDPHTPEDSKTLLVSMVGATDDSYIFSTSQKSLLTNTLQMECFQYAYGWLMQWSKSKAYKSTNLPTTIEFESVSTGPNANPMTVKKHEVSLVRDELDFLKTKVDDPASRFEELKEIIETFQFPTIIGWLPITLARKIVAQNIVSRCRALLYLQPIRKTDAESLDKLIIRRVHQLTGFPFSPNTEIATLPISALGLGFPSISRINAGIALNGINRDLNRHLYAYRTLAEITLNDWIGTNISILQGEVMGLIASSILSGCSSGDGDTIILTDHLNSVRLLADSKTAVSQEARLRHSNGRSYYRWLLKTTRARSNLDIKYTPGHSSEDTIEARMNNEADSLATTSNRDIWTISAPIPTFEMNPYTLYHQKDGWIESDIAHYIDLRMTRRTSNKLGAMKGLRMATWAHNSIAPPEFPYTKAVSAYSATVQLYARSGQLPIAETLRQRGKITKDTCRLGCTETETMPHLFVECRQYEALRAEGTRMVLEKTKAIIREYPVEDLDKENLMKTAECLFRHKPQIWPLGSSMFYLGQNPPIKIATKISEVTKQKIKSALTTEWHLASIRLAGRIFADYQRKMAKLHCPRPCKT
ncbi:hypothetical protein FA15DRAFT_718181 [Coprinopsis marcescibilis]|uniref:Uncharacterized protein n=1 Tax=Coprinopsis marcescibilis TaxID=230819 RepID=A0A5C3KYQ9_COPMA|nr:hypothetical protein FA15DRAFT_718181 [Coprinopsis marcescibilis]